MFTPDTPITGASAPDLTSPTYTLTEVNASSMNKRRWVVSALGGTQSGVNVHSLQEPFSIEVSVPETVKTSSDASLTAVGRVAGPKNTYHVKVVKGMGINSLGGKNDAVLDLAISVPVGFDYTGSGEPFQAALSCLFGAVNGDIGEILDMAKFGA